MGFTFDGVGDAYTKVASHVSSGSVSLFLYAYSPNWGLGTGVDVGGVFVVKGQWGTDAQGDFNLGLLRLSTLLTATVHTSGARTVASMAYPSNDVWHKIAVVYDESGTSLKIYVDSTTAGASAVTSGTRASNNNNSALAAYPNNVANTEFGGSLAYATTWAAALTNGEISQLMSGKNPALVGTPVLHYALQDNPAPASITSSGGSAVVLDIAGAPVYAADGIAFATGGGAGGGGVGGKGGGQGQGGGGTANNKFVATGRKRMRY